MRTRVTKFTSYEETISLTPKEVRGLRRGSIKRIFVFEVGTREFLGEASIKLIKQTLENKGLFFTARFR